MILMNVWLESLMFLKHTNHWENNKFKLKRITAQTLPSLHHQILSATSSKSSSAFCRHVIPAWRFLIMVLTRRLVADRELVDRLLRLRLRERLVEARLRCWISSLFRACASEQVFGNLSTRPVLKQKVIVSSIEHCQGLMGWARGSGFRFWQIWCIWCHCVLKKMSQRTAL